jgi:hypothetical protein
VLQILSSKLRQDTITYQPHHDKKIPPQSIISARIVTAQEKALIPAKLSLREMLQTHFDRAEIDAVAPDSQSLITTYMMNPSLKLSWLLESEPKKVFVQATGEIAQLVDIFPKFF